MRPGTPVKSLDARAADRNGGLGVSLDGTHRSRLLERERGGEGGGIGGGRWGGGEEGGRGSLTGRFY